MNINFKELDLISALRNVQIDCDTCLIAVNSANNESLIYWKKRYNKMVSVANSLRKIISYDDPRYAKPYSTRKFEF